MTEIQSEIVSNLTRALEHSVNNQAAFSLAAQFCSPPQREQLENIAGAFMFNSVELKHIVSQLEALFNETGDNPTQDVERRRMKLTGRRVIVSTNKSSRFGSEEEQSAVLQWLVEGALRWIAESKKKCPGTNIDA